ncbi:MAG: hypothetical protein AMXMBFR36_37160 [Acidobacteriota bacterium]
MRALRARRPRLVAVAIAGVIALPPPGLASAPSDDADPWQLLARLRRELATGSPLAGDFVQTFTPAGFTTGETESGHVSLSMPDCLRWDYLEPYRKSYLVCGSRAWSWVEAEPRGQRITIDPDEEMGLDLLLLPAEELAARYRARVEAGTDGEIELALEPIDPESPLVAANLTVAAGGDRPAALDYRDREGNVTGFRFSNWRRLEDGESFAPPAGVEWTEP